MKKLILLLFLTFYALTAYVFASDAPKDIRALEASDTTITLDWEDVPNAIGYYIYYGTKTASGASYEIQGVDLIDTSEFTLEALTPEKRYYIAITSVDEFGSESPYSQEFEYMTLVAGSQSEATSFRITKVEAIDTSTLEFFFSSDLDTSPSATMEFIVQEKISGKEIPIDISQVDENNKRSVLVLLGEELIAALEYKITVLDIRDIKGNTIESGIDAFISFMMPVVQEKTKTPDPVIEEETTQEEETQNETPLVDLTSAGGEQATPTEVSGGNAGVTLSKESVDTMTSQAAEKNSKLPQTGPEQWIFLLIITFLISGGVFMVHKKHSHSSVK